MTPTVTRLPQQATRLAPSHVLRIAHTVRHLRPGQIAARLALGLPRGSADLSPPPIPRTLTGWVTPVARPRRLLDRWRVRFLNSDGDIATPAAWNDPSRPKLWLYNLHYHDDLAGPDDALHLALQREFIHRWIAENPPGHGNGWEPYPISLRVVNWIKWALPTGSLEPLMLQSLAVQVRWLGRRLEWHLLGNHLLANAKALVFAGLFFEGAEADGWLAKGLAILGRELPEQILADGGHFELSPMYHAIILEDLLDILNLARASGKGREPVIARLADVTACMRTWLAAMTHPDGGPAFFNDCAFGIAATHAEIEGYAARLGLPPVVAPSAGLTLLETSGYARIAASPAVVILDVAAIGPDYIPGHAHADTLSFELSLPGARIVVNSGTSTYQDPALRAAQRATRAHSTVETDGRNSSDVWASFRVGRRARIHNLSIIRDAEATHISAEHDGYEQQFGGPRHARAWRVSGGEMIVSDTLVGGGGARPAVARFHLHPEVSLALDETRHMARLSAPGGAHLTVSTRAPMRIAASTWFPEFGVSRPSQAIEIPFTDAAETRFDWR